MLRKFRSKWIEFDLYMDKNSKHVSIESFKWYNSNQIKTVYGSPNSAD